MVKIYAVDITNLPDPLETPEIMENLPESRKQKILKSKRPEARKQSLGAGLLLGGILKQRGFTNWVWSKWKTRSRRDFLQFITFQNYGNLCSW